MRLVFAAVLCALLSSCAVHERSVEVRPTIITSFQFSRAQKVLSHAAHSIRGPMIVKSGMAGFEIPQNVDSTELRVVVDVIVGTVAMPYRMQFLFASGPEVFPPDLRESPGMFTPL